MVIHVEVAVVWLFVFVVAAGSLRAWDGATDAVGEHDAVIVIFCLVGIALAFPMGILLPALVRVFHR